MWCPSVLFFWIPTSSDAKLVLLYEDFGLVNVSAPFPVVVLKTFCCSSYFRQLTCPFKLPSKCDLSLGR